MRGFVLLATLLLIGLAAPAQAASASYAGSTGTCNVIGHAPVYQVIAQNVVGCSVSHAGTASTTAADCTATTCAVAATGGVQVSANPPGFLLAASTLFTSQASSPICYHASPLPSGSHGCSGTAQPLAVSVAPGACAAFFVISVGRWNSHVSTPVGTAGSPWYLEASVVRGFTLCRDAAGTPAIA